MAVNKTETGRLGEQMAEAYLKECGYAIIGRNVRCGHKEIDLICKDGSYIVFVEVKARTETDHGLPAECITQRKQALLRTAALMYLQKNGLADAFCRFDAIEVYLTTGKINHIPNAF